MFKQMSKIIPLNKPNSSFELDDEVRIRIESLQEDLNEKRHKNKRIQNWDNLFSVSFILLLIFTILIISGLIPISSNFSSIVASTIIPSAIGLIRYIIKRNAT